MTISGAGSAWNVASSPFRTFGVVVGDDGSTGTIRVADGGLLNVTPGLLLGSDDGDGTLVIGADAGASPEAPGLVQTPSIETAVGGTVVFNHTDASYDFALPISGSGQVAQHAGVTVLTGANTYSGGTSIHGGTLAIADDANLGDPAGSLTLDGGALRVTGSFVSTRPVTLGSSDGTVEVASGNEFDLSGTVSGPGALVKGGEGRLALSGTGSYTGGTTVAEGDLLATSAGALGSGPVSVDGDPGKHRQLAFDGPDAAATDLEIAVESGQLAFSNGASAANAVITNNDASNNFSFSGSSSAGTATISNHGGILFHDSSSAGESSILTTNRLVFNDSSAAGKARITNRGDIYFAHDASADEAVITNEAGATIDVSRHDGSLAIGSVSGAGDIRLGGNALVLGDLGQDDVIDGVIQDGGTDGGVGGSLTKTGAGTLTLTGINTHTGDTTVANGTLLVNGSSSGSAHVVHDGATLGGSGKVGSTTVNAGGTLAPGNSIGTLEIDGDLTFEAGSRFEVEVDPQGSASDRVVVSGDTLLNGGSVAHVGASGKYDLRSAYTILSSEGMLSGRFDDVTSDFAFLTPDLLYDHDAGTIQLALSRNDREFAAPALTPNQTTTAGGIDSIGLDAAHPVYDAIAMLPDNDDRIRASLDALSGEIHASVKTALIEDSRFIRNAANDRIRAAFAAPGASKAAVQAYGPDQAPVQVSANHHGAVAWSQAFGSWGSTASDGNAARIKRDTGGLLVGADRAVGNWRLGMLAGYSHTDVRAGDRASGAGSDNYHLGFYGGTQWNAIGLRTGLAYTRHEVDASRSVAVPDLGANPRAGYRAGTLQAFGELGYGMQANDVRLEPFANLAHVRLHTKGYDENGGAASLSADGTSTDVTFSTLGLHAERNLNAGAAQATLRGTIGWRHAFGDTRPAARHGFSSGDAFTVIGAPIARNSAVIEAGLDLSLTRNARFGISYTGQLSGSARDHRVTAKLNVAF